MPAMQTPASATVVRSTVCEIPGVPMKISIGPPMIPNVTIAIGPLRSRKRMMIKPPAKPVMKNSEMLSDAVLRATPAPSMMTGSQFERKNNAKASKRNSAHKSPVARARGPANNARNGLRTRLALPVLRVDRNDLWCRLPPLRSGADA